MTEKFLKSKTHMVILGLCAISIVLSIIYLVNYLNNNQSNYVKPYDEKETLQIVDLSEFNEVDSRLEIGLNKSNYPVFKNTSNAMAYLKENYKDALELIKNESNLEELTTETIATYIIASSTAKASNEEDQKKIDYVYQFLLVYKNSYNKEA